MSGIANVRGEFRPPAFAILPGLPKKDAVRSYCTMAGSHDCQRLDTDDPLGGPLVAYSGRLQ